MEIWIPLISACIGGTIATIPLLLGIAVQAYIHISNKRQKDREAKIQLALELRKNDIKIIEQGIDDALRLVEAIQAIRGKREMGKITEDEMKQELNKLAFDADYKMMQPSEVDSIVEKLLISLGDEFYKVYKDFETAFMENFNYAIYSPNFSTSDSEKLDMKVYKSGAKLHNMLREELISLRDTVK